MTLTWSGASGSRVDVYRDGALRKTTARPTMDVTPATCLALIVKRMAYGGFKVMVKA